MKLTFENKTCGLILSLLNVENVITLAFILVAKLKIETDSLLIVFYE